MESLDQRKVQLLEQLVYKEDFILEEIKKIRNELAYSSEKLLHLEKQQTRTNMLLKDIVETMADFKRQIQQDNDTNARLRKIEQHLFTKA